MNTINRKICITTLAIGSKYRQHALTLAKDIKLFTDNTPFIVLTDKPGDFQGSETIVPIKHHVSSVGIFHDKLDCVATSFKLGFDICIFLDADCRLLNNITTFRNWKPGLTAKSCYDLTKHLDKRKFLEPDLFKLIDGIARKYNITVKNCKFINEWIFIISRDGHEEKFLESWREIRDLLERKRLFAGEGIAIGMAARIAGWNIHHYDTGYPGEVDPERNIDVYKDKMFLTMDNIPEYYREIIKTFDVTRLTIESQNLFFKKLNKLRAIIEREYRYLKLRTEI